MKSSWLNIRESAVSLLRIFAVLIVLLRLAIAIIELAVDVDWDIYWGYRMQTILWFLASGISQGCILFALAWLISLIGKRKAEEIA